jgi:argininosuccinate lyase/amino-acid N-acetyltransferase
MGMWGGRFESEGDPLFKALNDSLPVDFRLVQQDVEGSIAWARALVGAGVLTADEADRLAEALEEVGALAATDPQAVRDAGDEDVHAWVEARLIERLGDLGKKLHTGRSRNDQVSTDLRLWTRNALDGRHRDIRAVQAALVRLGQREVDTIIPGYTHLQRAQPLLMAHWCLAYVEMLERDLERCADARRRLNRCPLGSAALAGTTFRVDRAAIAEALGFDEPTRNSLDAVADRDFVFDTIAAAALCGVHLSRLAEDLVFYASGEAGFVELDDTMTSGSSIMPQKKNPDALELVRGKAGRLLGHLVTTATMLKGLPLAYNKDMQEDKPALFDAMDQLVLCLRGLPPLLDRLSVRADIAAKAAAGGYSNATELADYLVERGVAFRDAHELTGRLVRMALERDLPLEGLPLETMQSVCPAIAEDVLDVLRLDAVVARRDVPGGTAHGRVRAALEAARTRLETGQAAVT